VIRPAYVLAGSLVLGLAAATLVRFSILGACVLGALAVLRPHGLPRGLPRVGLALVLVLAGWWWGSARLAALDRSVLVSSADTAGDAVIRVAEPPRRGRWDVRVRAVVLRWRGERVHEAVLLHLPGRRAPPQGASLAVVGTVRLPADYERTWLRRHGVHVALRASAWTVLRVRGGLADRLHAWLARASTPGLAGERRAVLEGVVLGEDGGLSDTLRQRFRASGLYHLLAVSGGNVLVVAGGAVGLALLLGVSRLAAEALALGAIAAYVLAVGPQPSVIRAGIAGSLMSLAWLTGRQQDRWHALLVAAVALLAWNPWNLLDPGFQLSFAAVISIFALAPRVARMLEGYPLPAGARDCVAISTACGLCTAPISWLHFHAVPVLTVPANAAAAPVVAPMLALALLAAVVPPAGPVLAQLSGWCAAYLAGCARFFGGLPGAQARSPAAVAALGAFVFLVAAYAWRRGERVEAGLSPARKRPAEDRPRRAPAA
jgi:ComEC/Rec2-related protein